MAQHTLRTFLPYLAVSVSALGVLIQATTLVPNSRKLMSELQEVKRELEQVHAELDAVRGASPHHAQPVEVPQQQTRPSGLYSSWHAPVFARFLSS